MWLIVFFLLQLFQKSMAAEMSQATREHLDRLKQTEKRLLEAGSSGNGLKKVREEIERIENEYGLKIRPSNQSHSPTGKAPPKSSTQSHHFSEAVYEEAYIFAKSKLSSGGLALNEGEARAWAMKQARDSRVNPPTLRQFMEKYRMAFTYAYSSPFSPIEGYGASSRDWALKMAASHDLASLRAYLNRAAQPRPRSGGKPNNCGNRFSQFATGGSGMVDFATFSIIGAGVAGAGAYLYSEIEDGNSDLSDIVKKRRKAVERRLKELKKIHQ